MALDIRIYFLLLLISKISSENQQNVNTPEILNQYEYESKIAKLEEDHETEITKLKQDHEIEMAKLKEDLATCKSPKTIGEYLSVKMHLRVPTFHNLKIQDSFE